ncbi:MAG: Dabb family protein [Granulosicoccus sp.]
MIRHCVFIRFKPEVSRERIEELFSEIDAIKHHLDGVLAVHVGTNVSPEEGMDKGYSDGFIVDFSHPQARDNYLEDAEHQAVGAKLVEAAVDGIEGILVYDLEIEKH